MHSEASEPHSYFNLDIFPIQQLFKLQFVTSKAVGALNVSIA